MAKKLETKTEESEKILKKTNGINSGIPLRILTESPKRSKDVYVGFYCGTENFLGIDSLNICASEDDSKWIIQGDFYSVFKKTRIPLDEIIRIDKIGQTTLLPLYTR